MADYLNHTIRKIAMSTGEAITPAVTARSFGNMDDLCTAARFSTPIGITADRTNPSATDANNYAIR